MLEDVRLAVRDQIAIHFYGRQGGMVPAPEEVLEKVWNLSEFSGCATYPVGLRA
jgi:2-oxoglutarate/2-oxoacid ferredoxin oxidoreductase subunit alpha